MLTQEDLDEDYVLDWHAAVTEAVTESGHADLLDSMTFVFRLSPLVGSDPDAPEFGRAVEAIVEAHLQEADSSTMPYGDVYYADEGLQADGKKRYPCDSEEHARAAWSYISMPKNAAKYSAEDLKKVKGRIRKALERYGVETQESVAVEAERTTEATERIEGRLIEALSSAPDGGRVFRVEIIAAGQSRNGRNYPAHVLESAVGLYEGAKAFDHHRTAQELQSSTITGLVGHYRNVRSNGRGLEGDLHLLPSARHTAEALDASIEAQAQGLPPIVGISHDALTELRPVVSGGRRTQEAVRITKVNSCDVVADPAAGGKATRVLAGGITEESNEEDGVTVTLEAMLAAFETATDEQRAKLAAGLTRASESTTTTTTEETRTVEAVNDGKMDKTSYVARLMVKGKVEDAGLPARVAESIAEELAERITESDVDAKIATLKAALGLAERADLRPSFTAQVTQESLDKKKAAMDGFFAGDNTGYRSFREMFIDVTGIRGPRTLDEDFNRVILRECIGRSGGFDSAVRSTESVTTSTFDQLLGDSITRRVVAEYSKPGLDNWRLIVSSTPPVNDFRTQRIGRMGGYGTLPTVNQGAPYQPLTTPADEEATYALSKRGGTEDLTLEAIANDDVRTIQKIPAKLGRAAAITLHRFVWDMVRTNATCTYDSTAVFHTNHANTDAAALNDSNLAVARRKMREQSAYGDSVDILDLTPRLLVVPPELEQTGWELVNSAVKVISNSNATIPNLHQNLELLVLSYLSDADDWYLFASPDMCPTIEIGFYRGQEQPELFTQNDPNVGSMFNNDSILYKIRHIYSGTILDHRAMYKGTQ